jgi:hypothetical protein
MKWKDLSKKERSHLRREAGCVTLSRFRRIAEVQAEMRQKQLPENGGTEPFIEPCFQCKFIAIKLGFSI